MISLLKSIFKKKPKISAYERFLSQATSLEDLERLERIWEHNHR